MEGHTKRRWIARSLLLAALSLGGCQGPRPTEESIKLGTHYLEFGEWQKAADTFQGVVDRSPGNWQAEYGFGVAKGNLGDIATARRCLETANDHSPGNMEIIGALAGVMYRQGDTKQMYQLLRGAGASLGSPAPYLVLAKYAQELKDDDSAMAALRSAIEIDAGVVRPRTAEPYYEMALLQRRLGNKAEATRRLRQAYQISHTDPRVIAALQGEGIALDAQTGIAPGL